VKSRITCFGIAPTVLPFATGIDRARAQTADPPSAISAVASKLSPVDDHFAAKANLGAPFQIDSGRIAEDKACTAEIREYAHLTVTSHIPVVDALNKVLKRKRLTAKTLLQRACRTMVASLKAEGHAALDRDYVDGQIGTDAHKALARTTLPRIEDHLQSASKPAKNEKPGKTA
jgi:putative membrane protein